MNVRKVLDMSVAYARIMTTIHHIEKKIFTIEHNSLINEDVLLQRS